MLAGGKESLGWHVLRVNVLGMNAQCARATTTACTAGREGLGWHIISTIISTAGKGRAYRADDEGDDGKDESKG